MRLQAEGLLVTFSRGRWLKLRAAKPVETGEKKVYAHLYHR
jgi:hypothetical protein